MKQEYKMKIRSIKPETNMEKLIVYLIEREGDKIPGSKIRNDLGITKRQLINTVCSLRAEGWEIVNIEKGKKPAIWVFKGARLSDSDMTKPERFKPKLNRLIELVFC